MTQEALKLALEALEEIALAGMSVAPEMIDSKEAFHARQAWRFIGIAARALEPVKEALAQPQQKVAQKRPQNCGTGYCSCIECVMKPSPQPEQEPCGGCGGSGWVSRDPDIGTDQECFVCEGAGVIKPQQEPVAWMHTDGLGGIQAFTNEPPPSLKAKCRPLIFGDTSPPQRKPLTDEEILYMCTSVPDYDIGNHDLIQFARAIEAAHNIKD